MVDPCGNKSANSLTSSTLEDKVYTITDTAVTYEVPNFVSELEWCEITYSYEVEDSSVSVAVSFDAASKTFTFEYSEDLNLVKGSDQ